MPVLESLRNGNITLYSRIESGTLDICFSARIYDFIDLLERNKIKSIMHIIKYMFRLAYIYMVFYNLIGNYY